LLAPDLALQAEGGSIGAARMQYAVEL